MWFYCCIVGCGFVWCVLEVGEDVVVFVRCMVVVVFDYKVFVIVYIVFVV